MRRQICKRAVMAIVAVFATGVVSAQQPQGAQGGRPGGARGPAVPGLTLTTTAFPDGGEIPTKFAGQMGVSPALSWTNVPMGTAEFVLLMHDPEPVRPALSVNGDITHWLMVKIPATATSLAENAGAADSTTLPAGARQVQAYRGPGAGPQGPHHHYTLVLYALNAPLTLPDGADRDAVMAAMEGKVLGRALIVGRFMQQRPAAQ